MSVAQSSSKPPSHKDCSLNDMYETIAMPDARTDSEILSHRPAIEAAAGHNDELPDDTKCAIRLLLLKTQRDLTTIDTEIKHTSPVPATLLAHRATVEERMKLYQMAIAPHRILPNELLRAIFMHNGLQKLYVPTRQKDSICSNSLRPDLPSHWYISHVCAKWRRVVLEIPELWNEITVRYDPKAPHSSHISTTNLVAEIFQRTLAFNSLIFPVIHMADLRPSDDHCPLSTYLIPNASRLRRLGISASFQALEPFLTLASGSVEAMKFLEISFTGHPQYTITVFKGARSLTGVRLCHTGVEESTIIDIFAFLLPWSQLTRLELLEFNIPTSKAQDLLQCCPYLEQFYTSCVEQWEPSPPQASIICPHMKTLGAALRGITDIRHWLTPFLFPHLMDFSLEGSWDPQLLGIITSSHYLRVLILRMHVPVGDTEVILSQARSLGFLNVCMNSLSSSALDLLSEGKGVPVLEWLSGLVTEDNLNNHFNMLERRRSASCPIEWVRWTLYTNDMSYGKEREDKLRSEGYDITISRQLVQ